LLSSSRITSNNYWNYSLRKDFATGKRINGRTKNYEENYTLSCLWSKFKPPMLSVSANTDVTTSLYSLFVFLLSAGSVVAYVSKRGVRVEPLSSTAKED
jgi:hypothetical protein